MYQCDEPFIRFMNLLFGSFFLFRFFFGLFGPIPLLREWGRKDQKENEKGRTTQKNRTSAKDIKSNKAIAKTTASFLVLPQM